MTGIKHPKVPSNTIAGFVIDFLKRLKDLLVFYQDYDYISTSKTIPEEIMLRDSVSSGKSELNALSEERSAPGGAVENCSAPDFKLQEYKFSLQVKPSAESTFGFLSAKRHVNRFLFISAKQN